jgi:nitroreductase
MAPLSKRRIFVEALENILGRRSIRNYKADGIPPEDLKQILEAGRWAPSQGNKQPWHFILVDNPEQKRQLAEVSKAQMWVADAAYILVAVGLATVNEKWCKIDTAIALENMVLAAHGLGYGTCWIGLFDPEKVKEICGIPAEQVVLALTPLGVPDGPSKVSKRKDWAEVFSAGRYGQALEL